MSIQQEKEKSPSQAVIHVYFRIVAMLFLLGLLMCWANTSLASQKLQAFKTAVVCYGDKDDRGVRSVVDDCSCTAVQIPDFNRKAYSIFCSCLNKKEGRHRYVHRVGLDDSLKPKHDDYCDVITGNRTCPCDSRHIKTYYFHG